MGDGKGLVPSTWKPDRGRRADCRPPRGRARVAGDRARAQAAGRRPCQGHHQRPDNDQLRRLRDVRPSGRPARHRELHPDLAAGRPLGRRPRGPAPARLSGHGPDTRGLLRAGASGHLRHEHGPDPRHDRDRVRGRPGCGGPQHVHGDHRPPARVRGAEGDRHAEPAAVRPDLPAGVHDRGRRAGARACAAVGARGSGAAPLRLDVVRAHVGIARAGDRDHHRDRRDRGARPGAPGCASRSPGDRS